MKLPLAAHRKQQDTFREQFGPTYRAGLDLIFCNPDGTPLKPNSVSATVSLLFRRLGIQKPKGNALHLLRHTLASHMLAGGVPLPAVSERLGHSFGPPRRATCAWSLARNKEAARTWEEYQKRTGRRPGKRLLCHRRGVDETRIDDEILKCALIGFEKRRGEIDAAMAEIQKQLAGRRQHELVPGTSNGGSPVATAPRKRRMSAAGRRAIAAAQRKRWAAVRRAKRTWTIWARGSLSSMVVLRSLEDSIQRFPFWPAGRPGDASDHPVAGTLQAHLGMESIHDSWKHKSEEKRRKAAQRQSPRVS
jgi:hypothetical protein